MLKRLFGVVAIFICILGLSSCRHATLTTQDENQNNESGNENVVVVKGDSSELRVVRYPLLGSEQEGEFMDYYESGLLYPKHEKKFENEKKGI